MTPERGGRCAGELLVVANPFGGGGRARAVVEPAVQVLRAAGHQVAITWTERPGHARELAAQATGPVIAAGGDGTVREVVEGLLSADGPRELALLPSGTGNVLAHELGLVDFRDAADRLISGARRPLDVIQVTGGSGRVHHAVDLAGWGLVARAAARAELMRRVGPFRYTLGALWAMFEPGVKPSARVTIDGERLDTSFVLVAVCNTRFTGTTMELAPAARTDDGRLDLVLVPRVGRLRLLRLFAAMQRGQDVARMGVVARQAQRIEIEAPKGEPLNLDGDLVSGAPAVVEVLAGAVTLLA